MKIKKNTFTIFLLKTKFAWKNSCLWIFSIFWNVLFLFIQQKPNYDLCLGVLIIPRQPLRLTSICALGLCPEECLTIQAHFRCTPPDFLHHFLTAVSWIRLHRNKIWTEKSSCTLFVDILVNWHILVYRDRVGITIELSGIRDTVK